MRLFGDLLPFIGFRTVDRNGLISRGILDVVSPSPIHEWELFEVEWLGHGFVIAGRALARGQR